MAAEEHDSDSLRDEPGQGHEGHSHSHSHEDMSADEEFAHMIECFRKAGQVTGKVLKESKQLVMPGESLLDIAETIEKFIRDAGIQVGFPANISLNSAAAHYTPEIGCDLLLGEKDVVKIDIGGSVEGCIGDTACTVDLSDENGKMAEAASAALDDAIASAKPGVKVGDIGEVIENRIRSFGFKPIENLCGHKLEPYLLHAGIDIPNVKSPSSYVLQEGDIFAIEPFATNGAGHVKDGTQVEIFSLVAGAKVRMRQSRQMLTYIAGEYFTLPFAERWLAGKFKSRLLLSSGLKELLNAGALRPYPVLSDADGGTVTQAEHTILVEHDSAAILTK